MNNERESLDSRYKITLDRLTCRKNLSSYCGWILQCSFFLILDPHDICLFSWRWEDFSRIYRCQISNKPSVGSISAIQPFCTHWSRRFSYFSSLRWCTQSIFYSKGAVNSMISTLFQLTGKIIRYKRLTVNVEKEKQGCQSTANASVCATIKQEGIGKKLFLECFLFRKKYFVYEILLTASQRLRNDLQH